MSPYVRKVPTASGAQAGAPGTTYYQYRADRARRSLHGIDTQVAKAEKAVAGQAAIKRKPLHHVVGRHSDQPSA